MMSQEEIERMLAGESGPVDDAVAAGEPVADAVEEYAAPEAEAPVEEFTQEYAAPVEEYAAPESVGEFEQAAPEAMAEEYTAPDGAEGNGYEAAVEPLSVVEDANDGFGFPHGEAPSAGQGEEPIVEYGTDPMAGGGAALPDYATESASLPVEDYLTQDEQDVLGEVANICMGTSATTMSTLLSRRVSITTPAVTIQTLETMGHMYAAPLIVAEVKYTEGLTGDNLLILKEYDVALITNVLLGESTDIDPNNIDLTEIHMSAMNEVMNQMVGSSATSLADILHKKIDISTPTTKHITLSDNTFEHIFSNREEPFVKISFRMEIEDLLESEIMQIMPIQLAKGMAQEIMQELYGGMDTGAPDAVVANAAPEPVPQAAPPQMAPPAAAPPPQMQQPAYAPPQEQYNNVITSGQNVNVQQAQFPSFNAPAAVDLAGVENIGLILDVPMNVTVELGRTKQKIKDILGYNMGSVIVLDKLAGDAVDILVNGKRIGRGEVVVIDDNYGVRITEINMPSAEELM